MRLIDSRPAFRAVRVDGKRSRWYLVPYLAVISSLHPATRGSKPLDKPLSVTFIGLYMLFSASVIPINVFAHAPAFLMGIDLEGWKSSVFFISLGLVNVGLGMALLNLRTWSRMPAIGFFLFRIANTSLTFLLPESRTRFSEAVLLTQKWMHVGSPRRETPDWFGAVFEICLMAAILWFLVTAKAVFNRSASPLARGVDELV